MEITKASEIQLKKELKSLQKKIEELQEQQREAREFGDLSENEEYHAVVREVESVSRRIGEIKEILSSAEVIDNDDNGPRIGINNYVRLTNRTQARAARIFRMDTKGNTVAGDGEECTLSIYSPVGAAIYNGTSGIYKVTTKSGIVEYEVQKLSTAEVQQYLEGGGG